MGSTIFRNLQAPGSALAVLGTLQPGAFRFLNPVDPSVSLSIIWARDELGFDSGGADGDVTWNLCTCF